MPRGRQKGARGRKRGSSGGGGEEGKVKPIKIKLSRVPPPAPATPSKRPHWDSESEEELDEELPSEADFAEFRFRIKDSESGSEEWEVEAEGEGSGEEAEEASGPERVPSPEWALKSAPWAEAEGRLPPLLLPTSSSDLLLPPALLLDALEVHEACRRFSESLRLSPFLFEDLAAALSSAEPSALLAELHAAFLRLLIREDEDATSQVSFVPSDSHLSLSASFHLLDPLTYPEVLRLYVQSDPARFPAAVLAVLSDEGASYPCVSAEKRLTVLCWLVERFLGSEAFREDIKGKGLEHDSLCRACGRAGEIVLCDGCTASYHLACVPKGAGLPNTEVRGAVWHCPVCQLHEQSGVRWGADGEDRKRRQSLGRDRHGRLYFHAARRLFVLDQNSQDLVYFSSLAQLQLLVEAMDSEELEWRLSFALTMKAEELARDMAATERITLRRCPPSQVAHLALANARLRPALDALPSAQGLTDGEEDKDGFAGVSGLGLPGRLARLALQFPSQETPAESPEAQKSEFRLGSDFGAGFRSYKNQHSVNELAKSPAVRASEASRLTSLGKRLSVKGPDGVFSWAVAGGSERDDALTSPWTSVTSFAQPHLTLTHLRYALFSFTTRVPAVLRHQSWDEGRLGRFRAEAKAAVSLDDFRRLIAQWEACLRRCVFVKAWAESLGHLALRRQTLQDREARKAVDKEREAQHRALASASPLPQHPDFRADVVWVRYARYPKGAPAHQLWKSRSGDELYRLNGFRQLGGWQWVSSNRRRRTAEPGQDQQAKQDRLESLLSKAMKRKEATLKQATEAAVLEVKKGCYSALCGSSEAQESCYSPLCRSRAEAAREALAKSPPKPKPMERGESEPTPQEFLVRGSGRRSLMVLEDWALRELARSGGQRCRELGRGFSEKAGPSRLVWPYPCARPVLWLAWRYRLAMARSEGALAHLLRLLYASIAWADVDPKARDAHKSYETKFTQRHARSYESRTLLRHRAVTRDGLLCQYLVKVGVVPIGAVGKASPSPSPSASRAASPAVEEEASPRARSGGGSRSLRTLAKKRKRYDETGEEGPGQTASAQRPVQASVRELWMDEAQLFVWEVRNYWWQWRRSQAALAPQPKAVSPPPPPAPPRPLVLGPSMGSGQPLRTLSILGGQRAAGQVRVQLRLAPPTASPTNTANAATTASPNTRPIFTVHRAGGGTMKGVITVAPSSVASGRLISMTPRLDSEAAARNSRASTSAGPSGSSQMVSLAAQDRTLAASRPRIISFKNGQQQPAGLRPAAVRPTGAQRPGTSQQQLQRILPSTVAPRLPFPRPTAAAVRYTIPAQAGTPQQTIILKGNSAAPRALFLRTEGGQLLRAVQAPNQSPSGARPIAPRGVFATSQPIRPVRPRSSGVAGTAADGLLAQGPPAAALAAASREELLKSSAGTVVGSDGSFFRAVGGRPPGSRVERVLSAAPGNPARNLPSNSSGNNHRRPNPSLNNIVKTAGQGRIWVNPHTAPIHPPGDVLTGLSTVKGNPRTLPYRLGFTMKPQHVFSHLRRPPVQAPPLRPATRPLISISRREAQRRSPETVEEAVRERLVSVSRGDPPRPETEEDAVKASLFRLLVAVEQQVDGREKRWTPDGRWTGGKKWTPEYRRAYEKLYRRKRHIQRHMETAVRDRVFFLKKEALKRRLRIEAQALGGRPDPRLRQPSPESDEPITDFHPPAPVLDSFDLTVEEVLRESMAASGGGGGATASSASLEEESGPRRDELHCVCRTPYDASQFYVGCDGCGGWFHGACVGISVAAARSMEGWQCGECERTGPKEAELYCVCRRPYDQALFYVGCETCDGWFHPACVGITQTDAENMSEYHCPQCAAAKTHPPSSLPDTASSLDHLS